MAQKLPNGHWRGRVRGPDGTERSRVFERRGEARAWEDDQRSSMKRGRWVDPRSGNTRFAEYAERWLSGLVQKRLAPSTLVQRESLMRVHVISHFGGYRLTMITRDEIEPWVAGLVLSKGLAESTALAALRVLGLCLEDAVRAEVLVKNPTRGVDVPHSGAQVLGADPSGHRYLEADEVALLASSIEDRYRGLVWVGALAGLRIGEMAALTPVKIRDGVIVVNQQVREVKGQLSLAGPKSDSSIRRVEIGDFLSGILADHIERFDVGKGDPLFPGRNGLLSRSWFGLRVFQPAVSASVGPRMRVHDLRHTHAALAIAAGAHPKALQERLGHASIRVTLDTYGALLPGVGRGVADAVEARFAADSRHLRAVEG